MKKILCYGDSNTFGFNPLDFSRFDESTRWTSILQKNLKNEYEIIEEGMCDRTGFVDNPKGDLYSAQRHFSDCLTKFFDIIILAIGTNDLQFQYDIEFDVVQKGLKTLINKAKEKSEKIIIIPPVILGKNILEGYFKIQFDEKSIKKSREIGEIYKKISKDLNCYLFDINEFAKPANDGLHYDAKTHKMIGDKLTRYIILK